MIGLIQRILIDHIEEAYGEETLAAIRQRAGLKTLGRRIDTDYADADTLALFAAAGEHLGLDHEAMMTRYADLFIRWTRVHYPMFFSLAESAREFLGRQPRIHATLGAGLRDETLKARVNDKFRVVDEDDATLTVEYRSDNGLCSLYRALFLRVLEEYGETGELIEARCRRRGDDCCRFVMHFETAPARSSVSAEAGAPLEAELKKVPVTREAGE